jgi:hypothetical protein
MTSIDLHKSFLLRRMGPEAMGIRDMHGQNKVEANEKERTGDEGSHEAENNTN